MYSAAGWVAVFLSFLVSICLSDEKTFLKNAMYNEGEFGNYVTHRFKTSMIEPPRLNFMQPFSNCDDGSYIFVTPRGTSVSASFYILDHEGSLVWGPDHRYGEVYNFQVQYYKGEPYLFYWAGDDNVGGHGEGKYYMLDRHYREHASISAGAGIRGDLHSFSITEEQTAVFTGYQVKQMDLTDIGLANDSWVWDSIFQEMDIESGQVLFEWRASDHFSIHESYTEPSRATRGQPWDYFHINMVDKDAVGNYLISSRYGRCVMYIDKNTGETLWQLGGMKNDFEDLSEGDATTFLGQHDAHWYDGHNYITMFDNRADWFEKIEDESVGHRIKIDLEHMTAELDQSFRNPNAILSTSQGSMQILPNSHVLLGYGFNAAFTEFTWEGEALCDAYFMPSNRFGSGDVQSYRVLKSNWTGVPLSTPAIHYESQTLYISWLGSTKVRSWLLQDSDEADGVFKSVQTTPKKGFETEYFMADGKRMRRYVRAVAVDADGTQLSISPPVDLTNPVEIWGQPLAVEDGGHDQSQEPGYSYDDDVEDVQLLLILGILAMISAALVVWMTLGAGCIPWRRTQTEKGYRTGVAGLARFRDDDRWRRIWRRVRIPRIADMQRSWGYGATEELLSDVERRNFTESRLE